MTVTGLTRGARGDAVKSVQTALVDHGITPVGGVDGVFGAGTETAVRQFQQQRGLAVSGSIDAATALALGLASSPLLGLTQGERGDAVSQLQRALVTHGVEVPGGADGIFGDATTTAVEQFQQQHNFGITGTVDAATAAALGDVRSAILHPDAATGATSTTTSTASVDSSTNQLVGLKIGSRGAPVEFVQQTLMNAGFTVVGGADGIFGALTANALRSFQNANGLSASGAVDTASAHVLTHVGTGTDLLTKGEAINPTGTSPLLGLRSGSLGADVTALQEGLISAGIAVRGGADGVFGPATLAAVQQYQSERDLPVSGVIDDATAAALASNPKSSVSTLMGLTVGALGNTVKQLQQTLMDTGIQVRGGADGIFGPATSNALKDFQRSQGLEVTGVVDSATVAALTNPKITTPASVEPDVGGYAVFGETGTRVIALQTALLDAGIAVRGGADGNFGGVTSAAVMDFQRRSRLSVTGKVDDATAHALKLTHTQAPTAPDPTKVSIAAFPVQGTCGFADTWGNPRSGGRVHLGVDIIASQGRLIYAAADGKITKVYNDYPGSLPGNGVRLTMADGTYYFYAHMADINAAIKLGVPVKAGQILGTVGSTGNTNTSHLHFEVHSRGGAAVNPYPLLKPIDGCTITEPRN